MESSEQSKLSLTQRLLYPLPMNAFVIVWYFYTLETSRGSSFLDPDNVLEALDARLKAVSCY